MTEALCTILLKAAELMLDSRLALQLLTDDTEIVAAIDIIENNCVADAEDPFIPKEKVHYLDVVSRYSDLDFKQHFGLKRTTVEVLFDLLGSKAFSECHHKTKGRPSIDAMHGILASLWVIANQESFSGISERFGVSKGHLHRLFASFIRLVHSKRAVFIKWPTNNALLTISNGFKEMAGFPGVVGVVDSSHISIKSPRQHPDSFYNKKGFHSVILQGIVTRETIFIDVFAGWPGSSTDARVFKQSPVYTKLTTTDKLPSNYHLLGDAAYPLSTFLLPPYRDNGRITEDEVNYNMKHSVTWVPVERAFGSLKGRFRRLHHLDMSNAQLIPQVITVACCLHNLCIEHDDDDAADEITLHDTMRESTDDHAADIHGSDTPAISKRRAITLSL